MKKLGFFGIMAGILALEVAAAFTLFLISRASGTAYVILSIAVIISVIIYYLIIRFREKARLKSRKEVAAGYIRIFVIIISVTAAFFILIIIIRTVFFIILKK